MNDVPARLNPRVWDDDSLSGDYKISDGHIIYRCPCGNGQLRSVPIATGEKQAHAWQWNGSVEKPTLTPSIQVVGDCGWHGFLTDGVWIQV